MFPFATFMLLLITFLPSLLAHPGHDVAQEAAERGAFMKRSPRSVKSCSDELLKRGHTSNAISRRQTFAAELRAKRGISVSDPLIHRRDFAAYNFSHESTQSVTLDTDETLLFTDNSSCVLQGEVTQGPYYVNGELIRQDVSENQAGIPMYLDIQIIDTSTCKPMPALFLDIWHCNATGVYSGVSAQGNGNDQDTTNIDNTFLRGIQQTDQDGWVQFHTIFPGHYLGRTTHIHLLAHTPNSTSVQTNATLLDGSGTTHASHVGQLFFDQNLISIIEAAEPYASNTQAFTLNEDDMILSQEANSSDPFVEYTALGGSLTDGIFAWVSIGIDPTLDNEISAAATLYESGGEANENAMGSVEGAGGSGSPPSGGPPSGSGDPPTASVSA